MKIEYKYHPDNVKEVQDALGLKAVRLDYILLEIDFKLTPLEHNRFSTEGGELEIISEEICYATTKEHKDVPLYLTKDQKIVVFDMLDYEVIHRVLLKRWDKAKRHVNAYNFRGN